MMHGRKNIKLYFQIGNSFFGLSPHVINHNAVITKNNESSRQVSVFYCDVNYT